MKVKNELVQARRLTPGAGHYFYGYYDNPAWSGDDRFHLYHRVDFWDRLPEEKDRAELGMIEVESGRVIPLAETNTWNFQQGAMLQWHPKAPNDEIIYNAEADGAYRGAVLNVVNRQISWLDRPVANVDPTGRYALSIDFDRMFAFRPGYGYAGHKVPLGSVSPRQDGVHLIDLETGASKLVLSLEQIWGLTDGFFSGRAKDILINHINFNTDGTRFVMLVRNFPAPGEKWKTAVITANADGTEPYVLLDTGMGSHYHWRDPERLVIYARGTEEDKPRDQLYVLKDRTQERQPLNPDFFTFDGHCSYSPDRRWLLYDSYPDRESYRHLYVYDLEAGRSILLGSYYSDPISGGDIRSDLHPRFNRSGTSISFDSTHEGQRHIYVMEIGEVLNGATR